MLHFFSKVSELNGSAIKLNGESRPQVIIHQKFDITSLPRIAQTQGLAIVLQSLFQIIRENTDGDLHGLGDCVLLDFGPTKIILVSIFHRVIKQKRTAQNPNEKSQKEDLLLHETKVRHQAEKCYLIFRNTKRKIMAHNARVFVALWHA